MASTFDLGTSVLCSPEPNLKLTQHATALVIPPSGTTGPDEIEVFESLLQAGEIWLDQAPELKLQILVSVGSHLTSPASSFFSRIGEILCHSKLLLDLGLNVLFKSCDHVVGSDHSVTFQLSLGLRKKAKPVRNSKALRIPIGMRGTHDALPPDGFPTACLSAINLSLEYSSCEESAPRDIPSSTTAGKVSETNQSPHPGPEPDNDEHDDILVEPTCLNIKYSLSSEGTEIEEKLGTSTFTEELQKLEEELNYGISPPLKAYLTSTPEAFHLEKGFHTLFYSGFQSLIADTSPDTRKQIETSKSKGFRPLSRICPSVFSLGYRDAMNQRSQFIPSIATSISSILERRENPALQLRRPVLKPSTDPNRPDPSFASHISTTLRTTLKQSLWRSAQKHLYKAEASKRLSPLDSTSVSDSANQILEEDTALFLPSAADEIDYADYPDNYDSDYYLGTEIDEEFEALETQQQYLENEAEEEDALLALTEDYTNLSIDMFVSTASDEHDQIEFTKTTDDLYIDSDMDMDINLDMDADHHHNFYIPPPALYVSCKPNPPQSDSEMLASDCLEDSTVPKGPLSQSTAATSVDPGHEEIIIYETDFDESDDMLCDQV